jgi:hypothetical protein
MDPLKSIVVIFKSLLVSGRNEKLFLHDNTDVQKFHVIADISHTINALYRMVPSHDDLMVVHTSSEPTLMFSGPSRKRRFTVQ